MALASHPTSAASRELWAVGFANITAFDKDVEHAHVSPIVIQVKLTALEPTEESGANIPATLKRESVAVLHTIPTAAGCPPGRLGAWSSSVGSCHRAHRQWGPAASSA